MKKKVLIIIGSIFIIAILIFAYWGYKVLAIDAAKKQSFNKFALSWMKLDYSSMYNQLSNEYKKSTTENEFINNTKKIYGDNGIEATNIKITPQFPAKLIEDKAGNLSIPFTMTMDTIAGKVSIKNEAVKVITVAIGIKSGKLSPKTDVKITGLNWQPNSSWGSYFITRVDNILEPENLEKAFVYSDNIYFAQTALKITKSNFIDGTKQFGIGEKIPFEYPLQKSQISKNGSIKSDIQLADSGYGQGEVSINPVQLSMIYGSLVNGGSILKPHLLYGANLSDVWKANVIPGNARSEILNDLIQVIEDPHGTGHGASVPGISLAGKTGTAEIKRSQTDTSGTENGWFVCVNTDNPKLLVTMMIENVKTRGGSSYVTPKVANVMRQFAK